MAVSFERSDIAATDDVLVADTDMQSRTPAPAPSIPNEIELEPHEDGSSDDEMHEPPGPKANAMFKCLFEWPKKYATTFLEAPDVSSNVREILKRNIVHHENFAGTGSAGIALHMIHSAFCNEIKKKDGHQFSSGV